MFGKVINRLGQTYASLVEEVESDYHATATQICIDYIFKPPATPPVDHTPEPSTPDAFGVGRPEPVSPP